MTGTRRTRFESFLRSGTWIALLGFAALGSPSSRAQTTVPLNGWTQYTNPYVVIIGDSITQQCSNAPGGGLNGGTTWRNSAWMGWAGATSTDWRNRLLGLPTTWVAGSTYPVPGGGVLTERIGSYTELGWLQDSGSAVVALGTNDAARGTVAEFSANIDWFMQQTRGRPVQWVNLHMSNNPALVAPFNAVLYAKAKIYPQLKILDWNTFVSRHPSLQNPDGTWSPTLYPDGVHPATWTACNARNTLFSLGLPYSNQGPAGIGRWAASIGPPLSGWAADTAHPDLPVRVRAVIDGNRVQWTTAITFVGNDDEAQAASGRSWSMDLGKFDHRSHTVCLEVLDSSLLSASLGCKNLVL